MYKEQLAADEVKKEFCTEHQEMYNLYFKASLPLKEAAKQETGTTTFPFSVEYTKCIYNGKKFVSNILWCQFCEKF